MLLYVLNLLGVSVFAVSGALQAGRKRMDWFGVVVIALVTAVGGGTLRDVLLGHLPVFWIADPTDLIAAAAAAVLTLPLAQLLQSQQTLLLYFDALGLGVFTILGCTSALHAGVPIVVVALMGVMTGVAGGVMRDVLCNEIPLILRREIYATASLCGAVVFLVLPKLGIGVPVATICGIAVAALLRVIAIRWKLSLPRLHVRDPQTTA